MKAHASVCLNQHSHIIRRRLAAGAARLRQNDFTLRTREDTSTSLPTPTHLLCRIINWQVKHRRKRIERHRLRRSSLDVYKETSTHAHTHTHVSAFEVIASASHQSIHAHARRDRALASPIAPPRAHVSHPYTLPTRVPCSTSPSPRASVAPRGTTHRPSRVAFSKSTTRHAFPRPTRRATRTARAMHRCETVDRTRYARRRRRHRRRGRGAHSRLVAPERVRRFGALGRAPSPRRFGHPMPHGARDDDTKTTTKKTTSRSRHAHYDGRGARATSVAGTRSRPPGCG